MSRTHALEQEFLLSRLVSHDGRLALGILKAIHVDDGVEQVGAQQHDADQHCEGEQTTPGTDLEETLTIAPVAKPNTRRLHLVELNLQ